MYDNIYNAESQMENRKKWVFWFLHASPKGSQN